MFAIKQKKRDVVKTNKGKRIKGKYLD